MANVPQSAEARAKHLLGGVALRAREHRWSQRKYAKAARRYVWGAAIAAGLGSAGLAALVKSDAKYLWVGAVAGFIVAAVGRYGRLVKPQRMATNHAWAASRFDRVATDFRNFLGQLDPALPAEKAWDRLLIVDKKRIALIEDCEERGVMVEDDARAACRRS